MTERITETIGGLVVTRFPSAEPVSPTPQEIVSAKIEALWLAADRYTAGYISGVAIGILTIGVIQQLPKCLAVSDWSAAIWQDYYARKSLMTAESVDDFDFQVHGPMPHSVPELQAEVGL